MSKLRLVGLALAMRTEERRKVREQNFMFDRWDLEGLSGYWDDVMRDWNDAILNGRVISRCLLYTLVSIELWHYWDMLLV
jgi:hypothetical protein